MEDASFRNQTLLCYLKKKKTQELLNLTCPWGVKGTKGSPKPKTAHHPGSNLFPFGSESNVNFPWKSVPLLIRDSDESHIIKGLLGDSTSHCTTLL